MNIHRMQARDAELSEFNTLLIQMPQTLIEQLADKRGKNRAALLGPYLTFGDAGCRRMRTSLAEANKQPAQEQALLHLVYKALRCLHQSRKVHPERNHRFR